VQVKTLKSLLHVDKVPARHDETLRVYVLAKILVAFLIDSLLDQADSFSPLGVSHHARSATGESPAFCLTPSSLPSTQSFASSQFNEPVEVNLATSFCPNEGVPTNAQPLDLSLLEP